MVIKAINSHIFPPTAPPLYKPLFHFIFNSQIILSISENLISSLAAFPQVQPWRRREELTLSGRRCAKAPLPLPPTPLSPTPLPLVLLPPAPLLPQQAPTLVPLLLAPLLPLLPLPLLLVMLRVPPLWPLPRGDIILELGPHHQLLPIPDQPGRPHRPRGHGHQPKGVIYIEIQSPALFTLSGYCRSPRPVSGVHHQATLFPCDPILGNVSCRDRDFHGGGVL